MTVWPFGVGVRDTVIVRSVVTFEAFLRRPVASIATFDTPLPKLGSASTVRVVLSSTPLRLRPSDKEGVAAELRLRVEIQFC